MILVAYTTLYRQGGRQLEQAARTLARERTDAGHEVRCVRVESKRDLVDAFDTCTSIDELHLIVHAGMYGPMFGTTAMPEQFSPHEWAQLHIPFAPGGEAFFHACRSGRWFAPFFARTKGVPAWGHHWYTTVSRRPETYKWVPGWLPDDASVYVVGQPGRKSHGWGGAIGKHTGWLPPAPMTRYEPMPGIEGAAYDRVAAKYDAVFTDIRVRGPEWSWLGARVPRGSRMLDLGCGTGALLRALRERIGPSSGMDASPEMISHARRHEPDADWRVVSTPTLPFDDDTFDVVTSMLSWRYLDWDPMLAEIVRVLRPGGRLLVVDMVAKPVDGSDLPRMLKHKLREKSHLKRFPGYVPARKTLVNDPAWAEMLSYNPIRAEHEYQWYFESRFPDHKLEVLDIGRRTRVVAFDTGPIEATWFPPQSYP